MNQQKNYPDWFLWIWEKGVLVVLVGGLFFVSLVVGAAVYLDGRLSRVEQSLQYVPPRSYEPPNLQDYAAAGVDVDRLADARSVYVPVYSHVYYQGGAPCLLETTLSIRNIDPDSPVFIDSVEYFDTSGKLVKTYLDELIRLQPLQTIEFLVERRDSSGGSGANFLVQWRGDPMVNPPLIEAVMVGTTGAQGISIERVGIDISR